MRKPEREELALILVLLVDAKTNNNDYVINFDRKMSILNLTLKSQRSTSMKAPSRKPKKLGTVLKKQTLVVVLATLITNCENLKLPSATMSNC